MNVPRFLAVRDEVAIFVRANEFQTPICGDCIKKSIRCGSRVPG